MSVRVDASAFPSLDAFDEEFGRERPDIDPPVKSGFRISTLIGLALAAAIITALALGWPNPWGTSRSESETASAGSPGEKPEAAIRRLASEIEALKQANKELAQAQQQATQTIAALQSGEQEKAGALAAWYSDLGALTYRNPFQLDTALTATNGQRSAIARPKPREAPKRDDGGPISLDPPQ
jgi:FtsZ-binding cell division protein ZapB